MAESRSFVVRKVSFSHCTCPFEQVQQAEVLVDDREKLLFLSLVSLKKQADENRFFTSFNASSTTVIRFGSMPVATCLVRDDSAN